MMFSFPQYLNLKWRRGQQSTQSVDGTQMDIYNGKVYVKNTNYDIVVYNPEEDQWGLHCKAPHDLNSFAMTRMNGQLVLAGGMLVQRYSHDSTFYTQDKVAVWNETSQTWEYPYPPMPTARSSAWLIHYRHYLIVVGGVDCEGKNTTNVEILDTSRSQWYNAEPLPEPCSLQHSAQILDTLYFLGSSPSGSVFLGPSSPSLFFRASLPTLVSVATSKCEAATPTWEKLPDISFVCSGLVVYDNSLLAIGGLNAQLVPGIHVYNADTNEWINNGYLPTALHVSMSVVLPSKEFLVVTSQREVYIGTPSFV